MNYGYGVTAIYAGNTGANVSLVHPYKCCFIAQETEYDCPCQVVPAHHSN